MLMRREHSQLELLTKLQAKGFDISAINDSLLILIEQNYQSDERFSEAFILMRHNQGKGPLKIVSELKQRGINKFNLDIFDWFKLAKEVRNKKFGDTPPQDFNDQAKQKRFLQSRGFGFDEINQAF
ncbi:RecX family transcriptional regulator [Candidatus Thioglobus sp. NP1]|nr:RecX family transcriptional regulator [Candidatus Thioglobus sp. NP1]